jgi:CspA family cold shock protein
MRVRARITRWTDKHYGFAVADDSGDDLFVHTSALPTNGDPAIGQAIECEVVDTPKGARAEHVTYIETGAE